MHVCACDYRRLCVVQYTHYCTHVSTCTYNHRTILPKANKHPFAHSCPRMHIYTSSLIAIRTGDAGRRSQSMGTMEGGSRAGLSGSRNHHYSKSSTASSSSSSSSSTLKFESKLNLSDHDSLMRDVAWNHFHRVQVTLPTRVKLAVKTHKGQATCARYNTAGNLLVSGGVRECVGCVCRVYIVCVCAPGTAGLCHRYMDFAAFLLTSM